jgi:hypothetical protein
MLERWGNWINQHERAAFAALIAFYALIVVGQGTLKLVWADELITFYIARQPGWGGIWRALQAGADPNPPLMHILVQAATRVLGGNALGIRLPAMLCVLLALVSLWWMLRRWVRPIFALAGCLAFMATRGFDYAYDARSYAPMMGFAMVSLALWMLAGDLAGWRRALALVGMTFALAAGVSSNYYCVLAFFPIAAGELFGRRFRPGVWLGIALAALLLLAYLPLIRHNIAEFGPHAWNRPRWSMIPMTYLELVEGIVWPVLGLGLWAAWKKKQPRENTVCRQQNRSGDTQQNLVSSCQLTAIELSAQESCRCGSSFQGYTNGDATGVRHLSVAERVALVVLILYPFLGFAIALAGAGMISPRCVAPVCCGIGLAAGLLAQRVFGASSRAAITVVLILTAWVTVRESVCASVLLEQRHAFLALRDEVLAGPEHRIFVADSSFVLPLAFYSGSKDQQRLCFPIDFAAIHRFERDDSGEQNLWAGRHAVFPFAIGTIDDFARNPDLNDPSAILVARPDGWLAHVLQANGVRLRVQDPDDNWNRAGGVFTPMAHPETRILVPR